MSDYNDLRDGLERFVKSQLHPVSLVCTVDSVDMPTLTCYCIPVNGDADIIGVRLMAQVSNGFLVIPSVGSYVVVTFIDSDNAYVAKTSSLTEIDLDGKSYGGLTKTRELQSQLNKLNAQLQAVITSLTTWTPVPSDGGTALKAFFGTEIAGKLPGDFSNIESQTVFHGDGT